MMDLSLWMEISNSSSDHNISFEIVVHHEKGNRITQEDNYVCCSVMNGQLVAVLDGHIDSGTSEQVSLILCSIFKEEYINIWNKIGCRDDLNDEHLKQILENTFDRLDILTRDNKSGTTVSLIYIYPIGRDDGGARVLKVMAATLGDSPVYIQDKGIEILMPIHSAVQHKDDINWIMKYAKEAHDAKDYSHPFYGVEIDDGYVYINAYSHDHIRGLAVTRALGNRDFFTVLQKTPDVALFVVSTKANILIASDGVLTNLEKNIKTNMKKLLMIAQEDGAEQMFKMLPNFDNVTCIYIQMSEENTTVKKPAVIKEQG